MLLNAERKTEREETLEQAVQRMIFYINAKIELISSNLSLEDKRYFVDELRSEILGMKNLLRFIPGQAETCRQLDRLTGEVFKKYYK